MPVDLTSETLNERVAKEIRAEMAREGMTQWALAEQLGRNQAYVSDRLTCKTPLTLDVIEEIALVLEVRVERLFRFDDPAPPRRRRRAS